MLKRIFVIGSLCLIAFSCGKDKPIDITNEVDQGTLNLRINHKFGEQEFMINQIFTLDNGQRIKFSALKYLLSGLKLEHQTTAHQFNGLYLLCSTDKNDYELGKLAPSLFNQLSFDIGVDSLTNHADPTAFAATHPLGQALQSMYWGWNSGFVFILAEGSVDTTNLGTGAFDQNFVFHIGGDMLFESGNLLTQEILIEKGKTTLVNLDADYKRIFDDLNLKGNCVTMTFDNYQLARMVSGNFKNVFVP